MDFERVFLTLTIRNNQARDAIECHIEDNFFSKKNDNRAVWVFIRKFFLQYQTTPSMDVTKAEFPDWDEEVADATFEWLCDKLQERWVYNQINTEMLKVSASQQRREPYKSLDIITSTSIRLGDAARRGEDVSWVGTVEDRIARYKLIKERGGLVGIPFYWDSLTAATGGKAPGNFIVITARISVGKTWIEAIDAHYSWGQGHKVLFFSKEMGYQEIFERKDAIHAHVPFYDLRRGQLGDELEDVYFKQLSTLKNSTSDIWVVSDDDGGGVAGIDAKIAKYHPDIVYIDGLYLMSDDMGGSGRVERLANISRQIKLLASKRKIPIIATSQLNREGGKRKGNNLGNISWGDALGMDADIVIELFQDEAMRESVPQQLFASLSKFRQGGGVQWERTLNWDMESMLFNELDVPEGDNNVATPAEQSAITTEDLFQSKF